MQGLKLLLFIPLILLAACCPQRQETTQGDTAASAEVVIPKEERKEQVDKVSSWELSGALSAKNKEKGWTASLNWAQRGADDYQIRMSGPLGGGTVLIDKKGGVVTYKEGSKVKTSNNADELLQKETGIRLPVNNLYYWVRGLPAPGSIEEAQYDKFNRTTQIKQDGYVIEYSKYTKVNNADLPSLIRLQGHGVTLKVAVKTWKTL